MKISQNFVAFSEYMNFTAIIQGKDVEESVNEIESELLKALLIHNDKDDRVIFLMLLKLTLSFLNKAVDNSDNSSLKTFVLELSNADPTLYLSHQHLHNLCKFEKNFESTEKVMVAMKYAIKVLHHDATPKLNDLKSALPALKYHENHRKFIPIVLQGTIHILRMLLYSPKLNLTSKFFTKTIFSSKPTNFFFNITF